MEPSYFFVFWAPHLQKLQTQESYETCPRNPNPRPHTFTNQDPLTSGLFSKVHSFSSVQSIALLSPPSVLMLENKRLRTTPHRKCLGQGVKGPGSRLCLTSLLGNRAMRLSPHSPTRDILQVPPPLPLSPTSALTLVISLFLSLFV